MLRAGRGESGRDRVARRILDEPVQALAGSDQAVALAGEALERGGVALEGIDARLEALDLGTGLLESHLFLAELGAQASDLQQRVLSAEEGEVRGAGDQRDAEDRLQFQNASRPGYWAAAPRSSAMRNSWLYLATRSVRLALPVLI